MVPRWASCVLVATLIGACADSPRDTSTLPPPPSAPTPTPPIGPTLTAIRVGVAGNAEPTLDLGQSKQFWAQGTYSDGTTSDLSNSALWQTSNPVVATVSPAGLVTAAAYGAASINASLRTTAGSLALTVMPVAGCRYEVDPPRLVFGAFDSYAIVNVTALPGDCRWTVSSDASWLPFRYDPGRSGSGSFDYGVPANTSPKPRSAHLVVTGIGGASAIHAVEQERPRTCSYVVIPAQTQLTLAGGTGSFRVDTTPNDCRWTAFMYSFYGSIVTGQSGTGDGAVTFSTPVSTFSTAREVRIFGLSGENPPGIHTIVLR